MQRVCNHSKQTVQHDQPRTTAVVGAVVEAASLLPEPLPDLSALLIATRVDDVLVKAVLDLASSLS